MSKRYTTEDFINKSKIVHNNKYDYSKVNYVNSLTKVTIICPVHGEFQQVPVNHLRGQGCVECAKILIGGNHKYDLNIFLKKAREVHGNKYDYSKVNYINGKTSVTIICPVHGEFQQTPTCHLCGHGCPLCGRDKVSSSKSLNIQDFIRKAREVHGDKYDYSKVNYVNSLTKVTIICPVHGEFQQRPSSHLRYGCFLCGAEMSGISHRLSTQDFIRKAREVHGDKYDYSKVNYVNGRTKVTIICPEHGEFQQVASQHLSGGGCIKCGYISIGNSLRMGLNSFVESAREVHGDKYDYSKVNYINNKTKVTIICPEHGEFQQVPVSHLHGVSCPICSASYGEQVVWRFLTNHNISFKFQKKFNDCKYKSYLLFDFFLSDCNMCIEFDGRQHSNEYSLFYSEKQIKRDNIKSQYCKDNGIRLLRISYEDQGKIEEILKKELELS